MSDQKPLVNQISAMPTNKLLTAASVGPIVTAAWAEVMQSIAPSLAGPGMAGLVGAAAALLIGYFVKDRANTY